MARLYYRHPLTEAMVPISLGGSSGGNEVTISAEAPTDGTELWLDLTENKLKYRDPSTGVYLVVPVGGGGGGGTDGIIQAGYGLSGGGYQSTNPTLHVGTGTGITVTDDAVGVNKGTLDTWYAPVNGQTAVQITDWNSAVNNNTAYLANGAANAPDSGWWFGTCLSHDPTYKHQTLYPYANGRWNSGQVFEREMEGGVWGDWNREGSYMYSRDLLDSGTYAQHNGTGANMGIRRCFWGMVKDKASVNASNSDSWRVTYYNTAGTYVGQAINIPLGTGVVSHPQGHSTTMSALRTRQPILADTAATVGVVLEIVANALASAGIDINPTAVARLVEESQR